MKISSAALRELLPHLWLALGTFATGTESFMVAALLPGLASDLSVSLTAAAQLMTVFALTYALSSPLLAAATGGMGRRKVLLASMTAFALANFVAAAAVDYWQLMAARILLACAAGLYVPSASALAGVVVSPQRRGTALAIVTGGSSIAVALGVPLGAVIGHAMGWRMTFICVGILASLAVAGLLVGLPRGVGSGLGVPSLRERMAVIQQPPVLVALLVTVIWGTGAYTIYSYLAPYLTDVVGIEGSHIGLVLFIWGCAAVTGLFSGGAINDRLGARAMIIPALALLALAFASFSFVPSLAAGKTLLACVVVAIVVWGVAGWGFFPAQQARLIGMPAESRRSFCRSTRRPCIWDFRSAPRSGRSRWSMPRSRAWAGSPLFVKSWRSPSCWYRQGRRARWHRLRRWALNYRREQGCNVRKNRKWLPPLRGKRTLTPPAWRAARARAPHWRRYRRSPARRSGRRERRRRSCRARAESRRGHTRKRSSTPRCPRS